MPLHAPQQRTRTTGPTLEYMESFKNSQGKYQCVNCDKSYLHFKHLKRHYMKHTGNRPHVCRICQDTFCRSDILKRHYARCLAKFQVTGKCAAVSRVPKRIIPQPTYMVQEVPQYYPYSQQQPQQQPQSPNQLQSQLQLPLPQIRRSPALSAMPSSLPTNLPPPQSLPTLGLSPLPSPTSAYSPTYTMANYTITKPSSPPPQQQPQQQQLQPHQQQYPVTYHPYPYASPPFYAVSARPSSGQGLAIYQPEKQPQQQLPSLDDRYTNIYPSSPRSASANAVVGAQPAPPQTPTTEEDNGQAGQARMGAPPYGSFYHATTASNAAAVTPAVAVPSPASSATASPESSIAKHQQYQYTQETFTLQPQQ